MSGNPAVHSSATEIPGVGHAGEGRCNLMALFVSGGEWKVPR